LGKYAKLLGKDLIKIQVSYDADGVTIGVWGMPNTPYSSLDDSNLALYKAMKQREISPSDDEKLRAFRNKFELRLNEEFPREGGPVNGSDAEIQAFLDGLHFRKRRALMMTQKQFSASYPNGYTQA
jgi:hypothetical protein